MAGKLSVAVTGGTGFVGRAVLDALLRRGVEVATVTRDRRRLSDFEGRVRVLEGDIADAGSELCEVLAGHDVVVHLAWDGLPNYRSLHHFETELPRQYRFLREIVARGLKSLLVTGTCFEYGMQNGELSRVPNLYAGQSVRICKRCIKTTANFPEDRISIQSDVGSIILYVWGRTRIAVDLQPSGCSCRAERRPLPYVRR